MKPTSVSRSAKTTSLQLPHPKLSMRLSATPEVDLVRTKALDAIKAGTPSPEVMDDLLTSGLVLADTHFNDRNELCAPTNRASEHDEYVLRTKGDVAFFEGATRRIGSEERSLKWLKELVPRSKHILHLGDLFTRCRLGEKTNEEFIFAEQVLNLLSEKTFLIPGNHDVMLVRDENGTTLDVRASVDQTVRYFRRLQNHGVEVIQSFDKGIETPDGQYSLLFTHEPQPQKVLSTMENRAGRSLLNFHGDLHGIRTPPHRYVNVSLDVSAMIPQWLSHCLTEAIRVRLHFETSGEIDWAGSPNATTAFKPEVRNSPMGL